MRDLDSAVVSQPSLTLEVLRLITDYPSSGSFRSDLYVFVVCLIGSYYRWYRLYLFLGFRCALKLAMGQLEIYGRK